MIKKIIKASVFLIFLWFFFFLKNSFILARDWSQYTRDGIWYVVKNGKEMKCGRMGKDDPEKRYKDTDYKIATECWNHRCDWGMCKGEVPLCCYKMEETGDPYICPWPERGYCHPKQCEKLSSTQMCAHGIKYWCSHDCQINENQIPYIPFEQRFTNNYSPNIPTPTPTIFISPTPFPTFEVTIFLPSPSPTLTSTPTPISIPTLSPTIFPSPTPFSLTPFEMASEKISLTPTPYPFLISLPNIPKLNLLTPEFKFKIRYAIFSSKKILDLPLAIFETISSLDKKIEKGINDNFPKISPFNKK